MLILWASHDLKLSMEINSIHKKRDILRVYMTGPAVWETPDLALKMRVNCIFSQVGGGRAEVRLTGEDGVRIILFNF